MKTHTLSAISQENDPFLFIASTASEDRMGDTIAQDGWVLSNFKRNPIALWMHDHRSPIGVWENVKVESGKLMARLKLATRGTSDLIDTLHSLLEQRILRAVSVGFLPLEEPERIKDEKGNWTGGYNFTKQELLEISVVTVPANQEALAVARAKGISEDMIRRVFGPSGQDTRGVVRNTGRPPDRQTPPKGTTNVKTLAERIAAREASIVTLRDQLTELTAKEQLEEQDTVQIEELTGRIGEEEKQLGTLKSAQAALAEKSAPAGSPSAPAAPARVRAVGSPEPGMLLVRAAIVALRSHHERRSIDEIIRTNYNGSAELEAVTRAAVAPAETTVAGWAAELVNTTTGEFLDQLRAESIFFRAPMDRFSFGRGKLRLPGASGQGLAGDFVGEGAPIPVKQALLTSITMEPHKLAVITTLTRELAMLSDPAAEPLLRSLMINDTRETVDSKFLDAVAGTAIRPAGLQALSTGGNTRASSGTTLANVITDLKAAINGITTNKMGRRLAWIMNTEHALSLQLMTNAAGAFMFRDELGQGTLLGIPALHSTTVPTGIVFLVDMAEIAGAYAASPEIDVSEQATLHMENTTPLPIVTGAAPGTHANPVRSLFQTASVGLRLIWDMTWAQRRTGAVQTVTGVSW